jgi:hypothetical protein
VEDVDLLRLQPGEREHVEHAFREVPLLQRPASEGATSARSMLIPIASSRTRRAFASINVRFRIFPRVSNGATLQMLKCATQSGISFAAL